MTRRGKLLAFEGIDGAGKRTQVELLSRALLSKGIAAIDVSFPRYQSFFGQAVARYLAGEFGKLGDVDPHFSALLYAGDRLEAKAEIDLALGAERVVVADRYVGSNLAHQGARVLPERRPEFLAWLRRLEYEVFGLPREDLAIYLRVPVEESARRTAARGRRLAHDIQEADQQHLAEAARVYDDLSAGPGWAIVEGFDRDANRSKEPADIHREILAVVERHLIASETPVRETGSEGSGIQRTKN